MTVVFFPGKTDQNQKQRFKQLSTETTLSFLQVEILDHYMVTMTKGKLANPCCCYAEPETAAHYRSR